MPVMRGKCADSVAFGLGAGPRGENRPMSQSDCRPDPNYWGQRDNRSVDELIAAIASRQGGVVGRDQLRACGVADKAIDYRVKVGRLRAIHRGVFAVGHDAIPARGRLVAGLLVAGKGAALSHRSAAHLLALLPSMPPFVEITTTTHRRANRPGLVFHNATNLETTRRHGLPVTTPIRTLKDLAATRPAAELERAASEALVLKLVTHEDLQAQGGRLAKLIVAPTQSGLERAFLKAVLRSKLPAPLTHHRVGPYTVDFYWPSHRLVVETDGARYHDHELARRRDRRRDAELQVRGCTVIRVDEVEAGVETVARFLSRPATRTAP
jgi:very-short-patch-repair endonuclease